MLANYLLARGGRKQGLFTHSGSASSAFFSFEQVLNRQIGSTAKNAENAKENLKTAKALAHEHVAQVLGYLKSARLEHGLLINFGSYKVELRKFAWS